LTHALKNEKRSVREQAVAALLNIGPDARAAVPALLELLQNAKETVEIRHGAASALVAIGPDAKAALIEVSKGQDNDLKQMALHALSEIDPKAFPPKPTGKR
jgi:HEAT repeat protein